MRSKEQTCCPGCPWEYEESIMRSSFSSAFPAERRANKTDRAECARAATQARVAPDTAADPTNLEVRKRQQRHYDRDAPH